MSKEHPWRDRLTPCELAMARLTFIAAMTNAPYLKKKARKRLQEKWRPVVDKNWELCAQSIRDGNES